MRVFVVLAAALLAACAAEKLAPAPPAGVDLSGHWLLDEVDSDDPMRLMQTQLAMATASAGPAGSTGSGGRTQKGGRPSTGPTGPAVPPVTVLDEALRWPGNDLVITQGGGTVVFNSYGKRDLCKPASAEALQGHASAAKDPSGRDAQTHGRGDMPPPVCGWDGTGLVVHSGDPRDDPTPFERRFRLSDNSEQLIEQVTFTSGRSSGFTASRVWSRVPPGAAPAAAPPPSNPVLRPSPQP